MRVGVRINARVYIVIFYNNIFFKLFLHIIQGFIHIYTSLSSSIRTKATMEYFTSCFASIISVFIR
ncbi:hypothetical protein MT325_m406L [Paramecium bursaria chlorella virus MT325]|uniref:Uncharacterized protein m406L n=1 Tax=Paramecium bursaria Chlorella virus MT325 TaxID=346932 RepID=A7IUD6_PBCVM|nr:hypothetical protein MT325_m406L [Paramecium bursaria chlorella virus MT325]